MDISFKTLLPLFYILVEGAHQKLTKFLSLCKTYGPRLSKACIEHFMFRQEALKMHTMEECELEESVKVEA